LTGDAAAAPVLPSLTHSRGQTVEDMSRNACTRMTIAVIVFDVATSAWADDKFLVYAGQIL
jgi:hypothetical protein